MGSMRSNRRARAAAAVLLALSIVPAFAGLTAGARKSDIPAVREATLKYKDLGAALADGYIKFYECTEQPGVGTMGQHYANLSLVGTREIDPLRPEVLVYQPTRAGGYRLVAVEYVVLESTWDPAEGVNGPPPTVLGQDLLFRSNGNRYGLPDFYERHAWIWQGNPRGIFDDWNPNMTCLGEGDNGG